MTDVHIPPSQNVLRGDVAIVGMSCLFAGAPDLRTYWRNIVSKVDAISDPTADDWDPKIFYDPDSKANDRVYCKRGGYIGDLANFRPLDFGIMPIAVDGGEPDQWLALRLAHEALADAGYSASPNEHERTEIILGKGTYVNRGNLTVGYHGMTVEYVVQVLKNLHPEYTEEELCEIKEELKAGLPPFSADTAPALIGNIIAGRIANRLDLMGSSFTVDAACASALLAIDIGVRDLLSYRCDLVLAGAANANAPLPTLSLFCQLGALSRQEQIRPFDKNADGTILGEGLGMIVLKRLADAKRDGNRIYVVIKGVGIASDGRALHVMAPRVEGEELALRRAYEMAGVSPDSVGLIEAHGTATPLGDVVEIQALSRVFGERQGQLPRCALGSVKSMIGHTMPAAGIAGVIKTALALHHRVLPPTLHCEEPSPALHLDKTPFYINVETRPWIHGADTPRRAGVNSFGFGGINGHVVLEEYRNDGQADSYLPDWESEVCILEAASRQQLIERGNRLSEYLGQRGEVPLKDLAHTLSSQMEDRPYRLAVVATDKDDFVQKLGHGLARLADPHCKQIKDTRGIYFFDEPQKGKLAVVFPGEGAQYPNMLLDLCLHFPEVRRCFDLADRPIPRRPGRCLPSEFIFPRSILSQAERSQVEKSLWQIDGAVGGVLTANWAMWTLLNRLEIRPDVIMGHSTGDYSAMFASNVISLTGEASQVETIVALNEAHENLTERLQVPEVTLFAVGADAATVLSIVEEVGENLYLAMDNCPHQTVLVGSRDAVEKVLEHLRRRALIFEILPFDRPYHTPLFQAYAEGVGDQFFSRLPLAAPTMDVYSCTTASRYPSDVEEIRRLVVEHWARPVLFSKTVETMYRDGVRIFVEAGPRGNLTAFISDILRGKRHLAIPANVPYRSGITQINHLVGILAAQGVAMHLGYLYARREVQDLPWEAAGTAVAAKNPPASMKLSLAIPPLRVAPRKRKEVLNAPIAVGAVASQDVRAHDFPPQRLDSPAIPELPYPVHATPATHQVAAVMQECFKGMQAFLDVEKNVMEGFFKCVQTTATKPASGVPRIENFPLLGTLTSLLPGQELTAVRQLNVQEDLFLRDHALGGPVSTTDAELRPLMLMPLTMSTEVLAEAAAVLMPGKVLVGMRDVQAHHSIIVDDIPVDLQISARRVPGATAEVEVEIRNVGNTERRNTLPAARGIMMFSEGFPNSPCATALSLSAERKSRLASIELYDGRIMFHGPAFQGVVSVDRSGQDGAVGQLRVLPFGKLFRSTPNPRFVTDPLVLDAAGQLVGFWAAEYLETAFVVLPYRLASLRIYGPLRPAGEHLACRLKLQLVGHDRITSSLEIVQADGTVWMELQGWEDRRFDLPKRFHRAWVAPRESRISEPWQSPLVRLPDSDAFECCRVANLFEPGDKFWQDLWASLVLTREERKAFRERRSPPKRQVEWLSGRTAAKDAVRAYLKKHYRLELLPADIEIAQDEHGSPFPRGTWAQRLGAVPALSLTHSNGVAVALVGKGESRRFGIDLQALRDITPEIEQVALTADEQYLLDAVLPCDRTEWFVRLWCTKEAIGKALGQGLIDGPRSVRILSLDTQTGTVRATPQGKLADAIPATNGEVLAYTARDGDYVVATTVLEGERS